MVIAEKEQPFKTVNETLTVTLILRTNYLGYNSRKNSHLVIIFCVFVIVKTVTCNVKNGDIQHLVKTATLIC